MVGVASDRAYCSVRRGLRRGVDAIGRSLLHLTEGLKMIKKTTVQLNIGDVVSLEGKPRKVLAKSKAFKSPEWFITFEFYNETIIRNYSSNKKWDVLPKLVNA